MGIHEPEPAQDAVSVQTEKIKTDEAWFGKTTWIQLEPKFLLYPRGQKSLGRILNVQQSAISNFIWSITVGFMNF